MEARTIHEEPFVAIEVHVQIGGKRERIMYVEKHPLNYHINWSGPLDPHKYLDLIQKMLDKSTIPKLPIEVPYQLHTFIEPNEDPQGFRSYEVIPPLTWEEILEEGVPSWFRYETPLAAFTYFPKDAEQCGIASSRRNITAWVGLIRELTLADMPEHDLSELLTELAEGIVAVEPNMTHYLQYQNNSGVIIQ